MSTCPVTNVFNVISVFQETFNFLFEFHYAGAFHMFYAKASQKLGYERNSYL